MIVGKWRIVLLGCMLAAVVGCKGKDSASGSSIRVTGSDTMVNLAQAWAEQYHKKNADINIEVKGGGSGVGIAALCSGKVDIATSSRKMKDKEIELAKTNTGKEPKEYIVGLDALAIYVHKENPLTEISIPQLAQMYGEGGSITQWKELKVENAACADDKIVLISRQNSSGTYAYFKEAVLGEKGEYRQQGIVSQSGSSDVVALVSKTPCAIGYSGIGYRSDAVKVLNVAKEEGQPGVEPNIQTATDGSYPIARPLFIYTLGEPTGSIKAFLDWVQAEEGQKVVEETGYIPVPKK